MSERAGRARRAQRSKMPQGLLRENVENRWVAWGIGCSERPR